MLLLFVLFWGSAYSDNVGYVQVDGPAFVLNGGAYYFVGTNFWYGLNLASAGPGGDRARLERELDHLASLGITNLRVMAGSEGPDSEPWRMVPPLQTDPGVYDAQVLDGLDYLLYAMNERGQRAIMCLTNFWQWSGGMAQYVSWNGGGTIPYPPPEPGGDWNVYQDYASDFYSNTGAKQDFRDHVAFIVNRVNAYTGEAYKDDPTIMAWELCNEPRGFNNNAAAFNVWIDETAAYIKSLDSNHLVTTGCEGDTPWPSWNGLDFIANHNGPNIDYATIHIWPENWGWYDPTNPAGTYAPAEANARSYFNDHEAEAGGVLEKPLVLEEFGLARDGGSYDPSSTTSYRDLFLAAMYDEVYTSASTGGPAAGDNFWAWGGEGRPEEPYGGFWTPGDDWIGDPPHEHQGWYSVYDADTTSLAVIGSHSADMSVLAPVVSGVLISNSTLGHTDDYIKDGDTAVVTATVVDDDPSFGISNITADLSGLGGGPSANPDTYVGTTATWTVGSVVCSPGDGVVTVTVSAVDPLGNPASPGSDDIIADNTAPTAVTGFDASPGHEECSLSWVMGTDAHLAGVTVRRVSEGEYPTYGTFVGDWPDVSGHYPSDETVGTEVYNGSGTSVTDGVVSRDIYFYQAFCYDEARNYGAAGGTAGDFSTNYWLGDVADGWLSWGYDALVDVNDVEFLSHMYTITPTGNYEECDVGPTVHSGVGDVGVPLPDALLDFEDLMIFGMNYGAVGPRVIPGLPEFEAGGQLSLALVERSQSSGVLECALVLSGNVDDVKGLSVLVTYDPSELAFESASVGEELVPSVGDLFFWSGEVAGGVQLDVAVLGKGATLEGSGEIAVLTLERLAGDSAPALKRAKFRDVRNRPLEAVLGDAESGATAPDAFQLYPGAPNPFTRSASIVYDVPREAPVSIRVYDVSGRLVRTLVDRVVAPGHHLVRWDGNDEAGVAAASGVYFCNMEAGAAHIGQRKIVLTR